MDTGRHFISRQANADILQSHLWHAVHDVFWLALP